MLRADLHVHTTYSGDFSTPLQVLRVAARRRLDAVAITDHDTIEGALEAAFLAQSDPLLPQVIIGEEVSSAEGHILGLFLQERVPPGLSAADTVASIHRQGGLAVAAHPFWSASPNSLGEAPLDSRRGVGFDGIEVANGAPVLSMMRANRQAKRYQPASGMAATGGSDAHHALSVGWSHTRFEGGNVSDLRLALAGRTTTPGRLFVNPAGLAHYAVLGLLRHPRALFRVAF